MRAAVQSGTAAAECCHPPVLQACRSQPGHHRSGRHLHSRDACRRHAGGPSRRVLPAALILLPLLLTGCRISDMAFRTDQRLHIVTPLPNAAVATPLTIRWITANLPQGTLFALFVDRPPIQPGQSIGAVCRQGRFQGCPRVRTLAELAAYLSSYNVYVTTTHTLTLPDLPNTRPPDFARHAQQLTIVLLDPTGRRVGEAAYTVSFRTQPSASTALSSTVRRLWVGL